MPHFHRNSDNNHIDLITFQFASAGGSFAVEISYADPARQNIYTQKETSAKKLRASQTTIRRRLGADDDSSDFWFVYEGTRPFGITTDPHTLAETVQHLIHTQAVPWWDAKRQANK